MLGNFGLQDAPRTAILGFMLEHIYSILHLHRPLRVWLLAALVPLAAGFAGVRSLERGEPHRSIDIILPTCNDAFFAGNDSAFYMGTASGGCAHVEGGEYGFVRNPRGTKEGMIYTRYHAGMDIRPLGRDAAGRPLDSVRAISEGRVVHVSPRAGYSNYGKYVVVEHIWGGSPYYSLYAHLDDIWVDSGQVVRQGDPLGRLGYTGVGINRQRAHLHFEINMLLSENFVAWHTEHYPRDPDHHGIYNGQNLVAVDVVRLYRELRENPSLTMPQFLAEEQPFFTVQVPIDRQIDLLRRYPWLLSAQPEPKHVSWSIYFTSYGLPLRIEPSEEAVDEPRPFVIQQSHIPYRWQTKGMLAGFGDNYSLARAGEEYIELLTIGAGDSSLAGR
jgi:hypothetical protein